MDITDYCTPENIYLDLKPCNKYECIDRLFNYLKKDYSSSKIASIRESLIHREKMSSTAIGNHLAIPHCRTNKVSKLNLRIFRSTKPINFEALDSEPVRLFFLLIFPESAGTDHLVLLSKIAKIGKNPDWMTLFLKSPTQKDFYKELENFDNSQK